MANPLRTLLRRIVKPSTVAFTREAVRAPRFSLRDWLHGYVYLRWPYLYVGVGTGGHPLSRWLSPLGRLLPGGGRDGSGTAPGGPRRGPTFADTYHGKVVPLQAAADIVTVNRSVDLGDLEQVIPYSRARDIVLKNPDHIVLLDCPCRASREHPCLPLDVCMVVGEPFASFALEHHPRRARLVTPAEAVEVLRAEDARGHVHHAFFKDATLGRFYAICNCCSCCCGAMQARRNGTPMLASSGFLSEVDHALCVACGDCNVFCQFGALHLVDGLNTVDEDVCMGCGVCAGKCAQGALSLRRAPGKGLPLEIRALVERAAG